MTLTTDATGLCKWCGCKPGPDKTTCECNCHHTLRDEVIDHLRMYDVRPDMQRPLADVLVALIDRQRFHAVADYMDKLTELDGRHAFMKVEMDALDALFPPAE